MSGTGKPLKVLMVHGYRQNATSCREKSGAFRKLTKRHLEPVFVSAPLVVPPRADGTTPADSDGRGWWFSAADQSFVAGQPSDLCAGFEESLATLRQTAEQHGPFDGVMGFSQGAALVALLCALQQRQELNWGFRFAILVAGFRSRSAPHQKLYDERMELPTLHVYGDNDQVIPGEMSEDLVQLYSNATVLRHAGGHHIPASGKEKPTYIQFLEGQRLS